MRAAFDLARQLRVVHRDKFGGVSGIEHANQARTPAGQGHQREGPAFGVEFGRCVVMRPRVGEIERQRGLRISAPRGFDAGRGAAERAPAVGADDEPHPRFAIGVLDRHAGGIAGDRERRRRRCAAASARQRAPRARRQDAGSRCCSRRHRDRSRRRRNKTSGARMSRCVVVDEADFAQRRGVRQAGRPHAERFQRRDRAGKQRRGAVIRLGRRRDQERVDAGCRQRDCATRPAGPPPMTATSALNVSLMPFTPVIYGRKSSKVRRDCARSSI